MTAGPGRVVGEETSAPDLAAAEIFSFAASRMAADGVFYGDLVRLKREIGPWSEWFDRWTALGAEYERRADEALAAGFGLTAGEHYWQAALSLHYAHFLWYHDPARHAEAGAEKARLYRKAAPFLSPPAERLDIPFDGTHIPAYLRLPRSRHERFPWVILIGGLESTKEESLRFENMCLARGLATVTFDGPGQGEYLHQRHLVPDFERYTSAIVDALEGRPELDRGRLGILGRSLGGHYAVRAAACDDRFRACVSWGVFYDFRDYPTMRPLTQHGFQFITGIADPTEAVRRASEIIDLAPVAGRLKISTYLLHGALDTLIPVSQVALLDAATPNARKVIDIEAKGDHCVHNLSHRVRPRLADWLARELRADGYDPNLTNAPTEKSR